MANVAHRLGDPVLVLYQRKTNMCVTRRSEPDPGAHGDAGLVEQVKGELEASHVEESFRNLRPHEHRRHRCIDLPTRAVEAIHECVTSCLVLVDNLLDIGIVLVQGDDRRDLNRLEGAGCSALTISALPTTNPTLQPAMECDFDSVYSSTDTALAPST